MESKNTERGELNLFNWITDKGLIAGDSEVAAAPVLQGIVRKRNEEEEKVRRMRTPKSSAATVSAV